MKPRHSISKILALTTSLLISTFSANAADEEVKAKPAIELGAPFADNAVLQREMLVPVWGWSKSGTEVTVEFAGQKKSATAGEDGKWMLKLDPLKANFEAQQMIITESTGAKRTVENILVGEVWLASGQSNMQWIASACDVGQVLMKQISARVEAGEEKAPVIREAKITDYFAHHHPIEHATAVWSEDAPSFSAIAYAFSYDLYRELQVPIGILNCSFSQTSIQAWTPRDGYAEGTDEYTKAIYKKILESNPTTPEHKAAWEKFYVDIETTIADNKQRIAKGEVPKNISTKTPANMSDNRDATWLFNARLNPMIPYAIRGCIWNQGYANMNQGLVYYNNLHSMIRGWRKLWNQPELPVYFHQFYSNSQNNSPSIGGTAEMRLGTWLARDIPNTGMASQIDVGGAIHYFNKSMPGQRLALHALKNQYGKDVITDGPMFKSYEVKGEQLIVSFDHAEGGLQVAETGTNVKAGLGKPTLIPNGEEQLKLFYLAGEDRVWHPASVKIDGEKVILTSPAVKSPRGVSYGTSGISNQPNLYNKALLPTTPFIQYENKLVTSETWPDPQLKVVGIAPDPNAGGIKADLRKMPILSTQFRTNAVLQADVPVTVWGAANDFWVPVKLENAVIKFSFDGKEHSIPVTPDMKEWSVTIPAMKAGSNPYTLHAWLEVNGEKVVERIAENVVFGDVYYVAAPAALKMETAEKPKGIVRAITRKAKGSLSTSPRRFSVATSTTAPAQNRFASLWEDATGTAAVIGNQLAKDPERPVGIIFMQTQMNGKGPEAKDTTIKQWIAAENLNLAPSLMEDYKQLASVSPGNEFFDANAAAYVAAWKKYWSEYIPEMIATKSVPDAAPWGKYPTFSASITTDASQTHNVLVESFTPAALKGIIFITNKDMVAESEGALFGPEFSALANSLKKEFGNEETPIYYTIPTKSLAPKITSPSTINGKQSSVEISDWNKAQDLEKLINMIVK